MGKRPDDSALDERMGANCNHESIEPGWARVRANIAFGPTLACTPTGLAFNVKCTGGELVNRVIQVRDGVMNEIHSVHWHH